MSVNIDPSLWRLRTSTGIPYKTVDRNGSFGEEDSTATETYIIEAKNLLDFVIEGFPLPYVFGGTIFYPRRSFMPGFAPLSTKTIAWKGHVDGLPCDPFGSDPDAPDKTYQEFLEVQVTYGTTPQNDQERDPNDPLTFLEVSATASGEFLVSTVRGGAGSAMWKVLTEEEGFNPDTEHKEIDVGQPINQVMIQWSLHWSQIPYAWFNSTLMPRLREAMGKVNEEPMSLFNGAPAETIMFLGFSMANQYTWRDGHTGVSPISLDLGFLEKNFKVDDKWVEIVPGPVMAPDEEVDHDVEVQVTHNHMYRPGVGWRRLEIHGKPLYTQFDLNTIFEP